MSQYLRHCTNVITKKSGFQGASDILLIFTVVLSNGSPGGVGGGLYQQGDSQTAN